MLASAFIHLYNNNGYFGVALQTIEGDIYVMPVYSLYIYSYIHNFREGIDIFFFFSWNKGYIFI